ncbi:MAG: PfkB family carbohydrate kinase [Anaerolineales bacterium]|jgi:1-phosphofructokinase family hexose kinase
MILCVCLTPTIERNWITPNFEIGGFYRVEQEFVFAAGKGINVARVIKELKGEACSIGFIGGHNGQIFQDLIEAEGIQGYWTHISGETRLSITIYDPASEKDATSLCDYGPSISTGDWLHLTQDLFDHTREVKNTCISGGIPPGIKEEDLSTVIKSLGSQHINVWLDLNGRMLESGVKANPFAIKVNAREISELTGKTISDKKEALEISNEVRIFYGISIVAITLGPNGAVCSSNWGDWIIHPIQFPRVISSIGCGDSFMGGLLIGYDTGLPLEECLSWASAAAGANTQKLGPGNFEAEDYKNALERVHIERVS